VQSDCEYALYSLGAELILTNVVPDDTVAARGDLFHLSDNTPESARRHQNRCAKSSDLLEGDA
jgi:hypothetical protein